LTLQDTDLAHDLRLSATDSTGAWFLAAPPQLELPIGSRVGLYVRLESGEMLSLEARVSGLRRRPSMPSLVVLEAPVSVEVGIAPEPATWLLSTVSVEPIRAVARQSGPSRPQIGQIVRLSEDEAVVRLPNRPTGEYLSVSIDPPEPFLQSRARALERTRPGTSHTFWRLQRVYAVYFAGIETYTLAEPVEVQTEEGIRWDVHVRFEAPHTGCGDLVRFLEMEQEKLDRSRLYHGDVGALERHGAAALGL